MYIKIKATPRAKKAEIVELEKDYLRVKLTSAPVKNRANEELIELLSKYYQVNKSAIKIKRGIHTREKLIEIKK